MFNLESKYKPSEDLLQAIKELVKGIKEVNKLTLVLVHNKTLIGQLYSN